MSRGEELRAKFKAKGQAIAAEMNSPAGLFRSALFGFVLDECQAMSKPEFAELMFAKHEADKPPDLQAWFRSEVKPRFKAVGLAPRWVNEPDWCYHAGIPMEFLHQFTDEDGLEFYVFRGESEIAQDGRATGKRRFYKFCAQDREGVLVFETNMIA